MSEKVGVGIVGYGFASSTFHAPIIEAVPHLQLNKIVQRNSNSANERYPEIEVVKDVDALYRDDAIDLVIVTTPSTNHVQFVRDALLAGKHVVVEKPFTTTFEEADKLIELAKKQGKVLSVFHNRRWDGDFRTLCKLVDSGTLGEVKEAIFRWDRYIPEADPEKWRDSNVLGSGVLYDLGVHFLDQALCLFGKPATIRAEVRTLRTSGKGDDYFDVTLGYQSGLSVNLQSSVLAREPGPRYVVHGTYGSFVKYGEDPQEEALKAGGTPVDPDWGKESPERWGELNTTMNGLHLSGKVETVAGAYQAYYQNIYETITGCADLDVKPEEAAMAIRLIELAHKSNREGRTIEVE
ncbi:oxidoreductase [Gracilibacillus kekensis]|uniref:Predicted dehydrogenase n=1 Tax=Gracilibacillus kekensis TaxID=1027249 RepID=A0A1M7LC57_9BACI|nr:oxidoreductase [Gracilibacillus kekensis]SHM75457.1 Predicted dehydrogenase [Gracilibacillus kekensis]